MATITQIGATKFRVQVRRSGHPTTAKTYTAESDKPKDIEKARNLAIKWGMDQEESIALGKQVGIRGKTGMTMGEGALKYIKEKLDLGSVQAYALKRLARSKLGKVQISKLTEDDVYNFIKELNVSSTTGQLNFSFIRSLLKHADIEWKCHVPPVLMAVRLRLRHNGLMAASKERDRRPTAEELEMLFDYDWNSSIPMNDIIKFAVLSAMRRNEILRIEFKTTNFTEKTTLIKDRKHPTKKKGNHQVVPVLDEAIKIIEQQPKKSPDGFVFPYRGQTISNLFAKACRKLGIHDLHFHDLRHEGTSRLFEMGYAIHEVSLFTGHEDWKMLERYTHLKAKDLRRLDAQKEEVIDVAVKPVEGGMMVDAETFAKFQQFQKMMQMMNTEETV